MSLSVPEPEPEQEPVSVEGRIFFADSPKSRFGCDLIKGHIYFNYNRRKGVVVSSTGEMDVWVYLISLVQARLLHHRDKYIVCDLGRFKLNKGLGASYPIETLILRHPL